MRGRENFEERRAEVHRRFDPILQSGDNTRQEKIDIQQSMKSGPGGETLRRGDGRRSLFQHLRQQQA
jgi:hypothetical protein